MDNLNELGDALPELHETTLLDLPHELREKINQAVEAMGVEDLQPYFDRKIETERERIRRRGIYQNAQQMHNQNMTTTTMGIMEERRADLLDAQRESIRASREYDRMIDVIRNKLRVYNRIIRTRNEPPFN